MILLPLALLALLVAARLWGHGMLAGAFPPMVATSIEHALVVTAVVAATLLIDGLIRFFYWHRYWRRHRGRETPALIRDILTVALVLLGISLGLWWQEGLSFTGLITASGATAVILGIALQTVIQDLFAGLSVNLEGSYALGDWLTIFSDQIPEPTYGRVSGITWRSTFLTLVDGRRMMVPNHMITANPVLNHSRPAEPKRLSVEICVDSRVPCGRVIDMLRGEAVKLVRNPPLSALPAPDVHIDRMSGDALFYLVHFYCDPAGVSPDAARSMVYRALLEVVHQASLPLPVTQVEMTQPPDLSFALGEAEILSGLRHAALFTHTLNEEQFSVLAAQCRVADFPAGGVLMRQGDIAASMFILLEGAARVTLHAENGAEHEVAVLATSDIVGEMSLMTGAPRSATVTAATGLRALEVTKDAVADLLQKSPDLFQGFSQVLARRQAELAALANRPLASAPTANDLLSRMRAFFSHALG